MWTTFFVEPFVPEWERTSGWYRWQKVPVDLSRSANGHFPQDLARTWREQVRGRRYFLQLKQNRRSALAISQEMAAYVVIKPTFERTIRRFDTQFGETSPPKLWQDIIMFFGKTIIWIWFYLYRFSGNASLQNKRAGRTPAR